MFKQQKIELDALRLISIKRSITHKEILYHFHKIVSTGEANELFTNLYSDEYIELTNGQVTSNPNLVKYSLSIIGKKHLKFLENEEMKGGLWHNIKISAVTSLFSLIVGIILFLFHNQSQVQRDDRQDLRIQNLSDSIKILNTRTTSYRDSTNILTDSTRK